MAGNGKRMQPGTLAFAGVLVLAAVLGFGLRYFAGGTEAPPAAQAEERAPLAQKAGEPEETVLPALEMRAAVPQAAPAGPGGWAMANLVCVVLAVAGAAMAPLGIGWAAPAPTGKKPRAVPALKLAALGCGVASMAVFLLGQNLSAPAAISDRWTVLMVSLLVLQHMCIYAVVHQRKAEERPADTHLGRQWPKTGEPVYTEEG